MSSIRLVGPAFLAVHNPWLHNGSRLEGRQVLQPKTGCLAGVVTKLPRLNGLVRLPDAAGNNRNGVLDGDAANWGIHQQTDKGQGILGQLRVAQASGSPVHATNGKVGAWRVCNHQVPMLVEHITNIALVMVARLIAGQQVARPRFPTFCRKSIADSSRVFTGYQYAFHVVVLFRMLPVHGTCRIGQGSQALVARTVPLCGSSHK